MKPPCELAPASASEAIRLVRDGEATVEAIAQAQLGRIVARDSMVEAWSFLDPEKTLEEARRLDKSDEVLPLKGLTVGVKDIMATIDMPTGYGSPIYRGHRTSYDAVCVARLRAAGALVFGKTVTAEFATYTPGLTKNPLDPTRTPGGSSSGSAAAVADCQVQTALGTQTAGSVIRPASFCGILGYKASYGRFSYEGVHRLSLSLDTLGFFARDFDDFQFLGKALCIANRWRPVGIKDQPRLAYVRTPWWDQASAAVQSAMAETVERLKASGAEIIELDLPPEYGGLAAAQALIMAHEASINLAVEARDHYELLSPKLRDLIEAGRGATTEEIQTAHALARECRARLQGVFGRVGGILTPSAPGVAPEGTGATGDPIFNRIWTFLGTPCVGFPIGVGEGGLPVSAQIVGPVGQDEAVLALAEWAYRNGSSWKMPGASEGAYANAN